MQQLSAARGVMGVYVIVRRETGESYIGSSANIGDRFYHHRGNLRRGTHKNHLLQAAWDEHGEDAFQFLIVERVVGVANLRPREQWWLDEGRTFEPGVGYNRSPATHGVGWRYTDEQRARLSAALTGKRKSPEHCAAMAARPITDAMREKGRLLGLSGKGIPKAAEHSQKVGAAQAGSKNHAAKLTEAQVIEIKRRLAVGERGRHLAQEFGVNESIVSEIKTGRRWRHVL